MKKIDENDQAFYRDLPDELIQHINIFLNSHQLLMASLVSKRQ